MTLLLTLLALTAAALALAAYALRCTAPVSSRDWRSGDVLSRRGSIVERVHNEDYSAGELWRWADERFAAGRPQTAQLLIDLAFRRDLEERLERERQQHRASVRAVRVRAQVRGVGA